MDHRVYFWAIGMLAAWLLCCSTRSLCQVQVGDNVLLNLDGTITGSYSAGYESESSSGHGIGFGGTGNLSGSYYSPQFLSFTVTPFFNQSRDISTYSSMMDSSGVTATANLFAGSKFPGYVSYTDVYNSQSNYQLPGIANFATNGNNQTFGVGWSVNLQNLPSLTVGYQQSSSDTSLYGIQTPILSDFHSVFATAIYKLDGFQLSGGIRHSSGSAQLPEIEAGQPMETANSDTTTFNFGMSRAVALQGNTWATFTRETSNYNSVGVGSSETADILSGGLALKPTDKLSTQFGGNYNDNIAGSLYEAVNTSGVLAPVSIPAGASNSWQLFGGAQYTVFSGLYVGGGISHEQQLFLGTSFASTAYSGSVGYGHDLLGGRLSSSAVVTYSSSLGSNGESMLGFLSNATYIRRIGTWNVSGSFGYSENVQTILLAYTSSGYSYSASVNRPIGKLMWTGSASGSNAIVSQQNGTSSFTQSYSTGLSSRWVGVSGGYSKSGGAGLVTSTGITVVPPGVPPGFLPTAVTFGGTSYSIGIGSTPVRGFTLNGSFIKAQYTTGNGAASGTANTPLLSNNKTEQTNVYLLYKFRKVYFQAGYSRLLQGFSESGAAPTAITAYYAGISRWFKFF